MSSSHPSFTRAIAAAVLLATALASVPHDALARDRQGDRRRGGDGIARRVERQTRVQRSERGRVARALRTNLDRRGRSQDRQRSYRYDGRRGDHGTRYRGGRHDGRDRQRSYRYERYRGDHVTRYRRVYHDYPARHYRRSYHRVRYHRPAYYYSSGPAFGLHFAITNYAPAGYYYFDPYCDETFASLEIYLDHCHYHHHAHVIQLVALDGGYPVSSYCWADGIWEPY